MSQSAFDELFAHIVPGSYISFNTTPEYSELLVNHSFCKFMGYESLDEFLAISGTYIRALVHPDDFDNLLAYISSLKIHNDSAEIDPVVCRMRKGDCSYAHVRMRGLLYTYDEREYVLFTCDDVSRQLREYQKLDDVYNSSKVHKHFLEQILTVLPTGVHIMSVTHPKTKDVINKTLLAISGYTDGEFKFFYNADYYQLINPNDRARYKEFCARMRDVRDPLEIRTIEYQIQAKNSPGVFVSEHMRTMTLEDGETFILGSVSRFASISPIEDAAVRAAACPYGVIEFINDLPIIVQCNGVFRLCFADAGFVPDGGLGQISGGMDVPFRLVFPDDLFRRAYYQALEHFDRGNQRYRWTQRIFFSGKERPVVFSLGVLAKREGRVERVGLSAALLPERDAIDTKPPRVRVVTFGAFDVYVHGEILVFHSKKGKEMLAALIDNRGSFLTTAEMVEYLWPEEGVTKTTLARTRKVAMRMMRELKDAGVEDIVETGHAGSRRIIPHLIDCDLLKFYDHDPKTRKNFQGKYLMNYPWSRRTREDMIKRSMG